MSERERERERGGGREREEREERERRESMIDGDKTASKHPISSSLLSALFQYHSNEH